MRKIVLEIGVQSGVGVLLTSAEFSGSTAHDRCYISCRVSGLSNQPESTSYSQRVKTVVLVFTRYEFDEPEQILDWCVFNEFRWPRILLDIIRRRDVYVDFDVGRKHCRSEDASTWSRIVWSCRAATGR